MSYDSNREICPCENVLGLSRRYQQVALKVFKNWGAERLTRLSNPGVYSQLGSPLVKFMPTSGAIPSDELKG